MKSEIEEQLKRDMEAGQYIVNLLSALLHGEKAEAIPENLTWKQVFQAADMHSVSSMVFYAAKDQIKEEPEVYNAWEKKVRFNLMQSMTQRAERDRIIKALTAENIHVLPVKGCVMQEVYPQIDWRQMCDLDMLVEEENTEKASSVMETLGYQKGQVTEKDIGFSKPPFMHVEIHHKLFERKFSTESDYYKDVWKRALPDEKVAGCYWLSPADEYVYQMAHFIKHYSAVSGSGIRSILDIAAYWQHFEGKLDTEYIKREIAKLKMTELSECAERLAERWFGAAGSKTMQAEQQDEKKMEKIVLCSGTYGTDEIRIMRDVQQKQKGLLARVQYSLGRAFPPMDMLKYLYPVLQKWPILYPFVCIYRLVTKAEKAKWELDMIFDEMKN